MGYTVPEVAVYIEVVLLRHLREVVKQLFVRVVHWPPRHKRHLAGRVLPSWVLQAPVVLESLSGLLPYVTR